MNVNVNIELNEVQKAFIEKLRQKELEMMGILDEMSNDETLDRQSISIAIEKMITMFMWLARSIVFPNFPADKQMVDK
jgi:uncharacterized membrane protein (DUF106 family)